MKLNSAVYAPYERQRKRGVLQYLPLSKKLLHHCLNIDLYPPPPITIGYVTINHNALLAFPREKISHYTTGLDATYVFMSRP